MNYLDKPWTKNYPEDVPHDVEVPEITVPQLIDDAIKKYSKETAILFYGTKISYEKLGEYIDKMASALHDLGIKKNSLVALYLPTCPQFIIAYYAVQKLGAIPTAVNFLFSPREIEEQLKDSTAECVIMIDLLYEKTKPVLTDLGINKAILTDIVYFMPYFKKTMARALRKMPKAKIAKNEPVHYFEDLIKRDKISYPEVKIDPKEDLASIIYTSGTTGNPKGVELTHRNIVGMMEEIIVGAGPVFDDSKYVLAYLPLFHIYGQNFIMTGCLSLGQTLIVVLRPEFKELLKYIEKYRLTMLFGVPALFRILINEIKRGKYDLSSLRMCACGSDYTPQSLKDEWKELTGTHITEGYGLTEACPATGTVIGATSEAKDRTGSLGIPLPGILVAIADPKKDEFLEVGELGEIIISGPQVTRGYWNKGRGNKYPEAFAEIAGKRWIRSGDMGRMDEDGYFYMTDRIKNIIKYKAHMIYPGEVEDVLNEYEPLKEVAVVGIPANEVEFGEIIKAYVVLKDEYKNSITKDDIIDFCRDKLAIYKLPKEIEFIDELPRNAMGKVVRKELKNVMVISI
jgi:long-chain acyl-CoA synthetase